MHQFDPKLAVDVNLNDDYPDICGDRIPTGADDGFGRDLC